MPRPLIRFSPRRARVAALGAVALLAGALLAGCGGDDDEPAATTAATSAPTSGPTTTVEPALTEDVNVYFIRDELMAPGGRTVEAGADVTDLAAAAVTALLEGPNDLETDLGMGTLVPEDTEFLGFELAGGVGTVNLSREFESGGGSLSMMGRVAQVVFTLTQWPEVDRVDIVLDGEPVEGIGGEGIQATDLTRATFDGFTPAILVEHPTPGAEVVSPLHAEGTARTFEGTVNYTLADPDGLILDEGFTTAAKEEVHEWGPFSFDVDYTIERTGMGSLIVYEISPEDGSRINLVEIPVSMLAGE